ncbi:hypothetical protein C0Q70_05176 [Pomacea canaliculata]|uniref:Uncharacterized protein n=1 Tax=Pomacea canaliculata TaxID=400727 RepID=A0A2T7PKI5_POMCA|nr:hypothetical protein C0Q70_05176 [Pomacea canaliculata]
MDNRLEMMGPSKSYDLSPEATALGESIMDEFIFFLTLKGDALSCKLTLTGGGSSRSVYAVQVKHLLARAEACPPRHRSSLTSCLQA